MMYFWCILVLFSVTPNLLDGLKINMLGSLRIGKEVVDTLSRHLAIQNQLNGRRSLDVKENHETKFSSIDTIALIVNSAFLCRELNFCESDIGILVNEYVITLARTVENIFNGLVGKEHNDTDNGIAKELIFEYDLKRLLQEIKKLLINANENITEENDLMTWLDLMKRINAKFQERAIAFALQRIAGNAEDVAEVMKNLKQALVSETTAVELKFENRLCAEHDVCSKSHECTNALNTLLEQIKTLPNDRAKEFIKYFYETLPGTGFYNKINEATGYEFQSILHDMAYAVNLNTKNIIAIVQNIVEHRINVVTSLSKVEVKAGTDVKLFHIILSDMDFFYSKQNRKEPFHKFMTEFFEWTKNGGQFGGPLREVMKDIGNLLSNESGELVRKLVDEVRTFMQLTVDPET